MAYKKRYEDSYLDQEDLDDEDLTDTQRLVRTIEKKERSEKDTARIQMLTDRLLEGTKLPGGLGTEAKDGLRAAALAYADMGDIDASVALWARIADVAEAISDRDLYYQATDAMTALGPEV